MNIAIDKKISVDEIKRIISTLSLQEQLNSFVSIVDMILYTNDADSHYWDIISRNNHSNRGDYEKIIDFLSPNGQFFNMLFKQLPIEKSMFSFEFPVNRLSLHTQKLISTGTAPLFISSKLYSKSQHGGQQNSTLFLNAFEYFIFSFFSYIYNPSVTKRIDWNGATDSIYCKLVFKYLDFFLFNDRQSTFLMQLALQSRTRTFNPAFSRSPSSSFSSFTAASPFHDPNQNRNRFLGKETKSVDLAELYFTETVVQVINEFWLNFYREPSTCSNGSPLRLGPSSKQYISAGPTVDQVCLVRVFLKNVYHLCYANCISHLTPSSQIECEFLSKLHHYRQQLLPKFFISKIYSYLNFCFLIWPLDLTFKIVLETWLSAIQPWRYIDTAHHNLVNDHDNSSIIIGDNEDDKEYKCHSFVKENIHLYSHLLLSFTQRQSKMDLTVLRNAQMLYRVAKVLSQCNLTSFIDPGGFTQSNNHTIHMQGGESLWSEIRNQLSFLFGELDQVLARLEKEDETSSRSWLWSLWESVSTELTSNNSPKRLMCYLQQSRSLLSSLFKMEHAMSVSRSTERHDYLNFKNLEAEHVLTDKGAQLTDFGRFQVSHGLCKLQLTQSQIDYYQRPVCSYEVPILVAMCSRFSSAVCSQFQEPINDACLRVDFFGRLSRFFFLGKQLSPVRAIDSDRSFIEQQHKKDIEKFVHAHPPQLRIRFLASKAFLFWFLLAFFVLYVTFDIGMLAMVFWSSLLYLFVAIVYIVVSGFL